ncbi:CobW family GTP-binding protein [Rhodospirillum sp. A1_3_36]|uniref:CobW family GTP-binding protein n=1 Tax=Rhodospirillum sp. A1_3_36 TaxID=3391666 RepID=UPI0039A4DF1D
MGNVRRDRIPLSIIGGFLGAGKTTLLNHLLTNANGHRFAVVVNDFGSINIDARLVVSVEGETIALSNGCICCVIREDLVNEVARLCLAEDPPDHVIIEASGVSRPLQVVDSFLRPEMQGLVDLRNIITLLDADQVAGDGGVEAETYADLAYAQIAVADLVVINKTDLVSREQLAKVRSQVEKIVPRARILETRQGVIPVDLLFGAESSGAALAVASGRGSDGLGHQRQGAGQGEGHAHENTFATWSLRDNERAYSFDALQRIVERLPREIYRAKGLVRLDLNNGDHGVLQVTGRRGWLRLMPSLSERAVETEVVFIGRPGAADETSLRTLFEEGWREANDPSSPVHRVEDLRAFKVEFI